MIEITTLNSFLFLILIVCVGFIFVEKGNLGTLRDTNFQKFLLYTIWGIVINVLFLMLCSRLGWLSTWLSNLFNQSGILAKEFVKIGFDKNDVWAFSFSLGYWINLLSLTWLIGSILGTFRKRK